jgi:predicted AAA+ superfamily ATPase
MNEAERPLYYRRQFEGLLIEALKTHPVVYLSGPRGAGKTTLAREVCRGNYVSFNSPLLLVSALSSPETFLRSLPENELSIVDEAHFAAELFRYPQNGSENNSEKIGQNPGNRRLLIGPMGLRMLSDHEPDLKNRVKELTLLPFSSAERRRAATNFLRRLLAGKLTRRTFDAVQLSDEIEGATFPELVLHPEIDRTQWFDGFLSAVFLRDIQNVACIRNSERIVPLLVAFATRVGGLLNDASVIKETDLDAKTYAKYKAAALYTFLTFEVEAWNGPNRLNRRFVRQSKVYFTDTNLLCYVTRRNLRDVLADDPVTAGILFENFIASEIIKQAATIYGTRLSHFCPSGGKEVDFVIEAKNGAAVGIDIKFKSALSARDFANLRVMRDTFGKNFSRGFIIYAGTEQIEFSDGFWAIPANALWE